MSIKIILALDYDNQTDAWALIDQLDCSCCALKVGHEMFTRYGTAFVKTIIAKGFNVFLDLKFHDIPHTVARACKAAQDLGVWMINVHASGGLAMMEAAKKALDEQGNKRPLLIAVTLLTSMNKTDLYRVGIQEAVETHVCHLAQLAQEADLDGVVCSAMEVKAIKSACGQDFLTVTPGIRLSTNVQDDQVRIMTPERAWKAGSDYLVVGRPVTRAPDPMQVINEILAWQP